MKKKVISKNDIIKLSENDEYYSIQRWKYYEEVIDVLKKMNPEDISNILEIGPYKTPIVEGSDVLDIFDFSDYFPIKVKNIIKHDCSKVPFPIEDKNYDLIIACQTMEHFGIHDEQVIAFKEFSRIAKKAIISLPFKWFAPTLRNHHMIDERVIDSWTRPFAYTYESIEGTANYPTNIRIYDFSRIYLQNLFFKLPNNYVVVDEGINSFKLSDSNMTIHCSTFKKNKEINSYVEEYINSKGDLDVSVSYFHWKYPVVKTVLSNFPNYTHYWFEVENNIFHFYSENSNNTINKTIKFLVNSIEIIK